MNSAVALILTHRITNAVLILRRGHTAPWMPGYWNLPGGGIDEGENPIDAIKRECIEEAGIDPGALMFVKMIEDPEYKLIILSATTDQEPVLNYEHSEYAWINASDIYSYDFVPYVCEELSEYLTT